MGKLVARYIIKIFMCMFLPVWVVTDCMVMLVLWLSGRLIYLPFQCTTCWIKIVEDI